MRTKRAPGHRILTQPPDRRRRRPPPPSATSATSATTGPRPRWKPYAPQGPTLATAPANSTPPPHTRPRHGHEPRADPPSNAYRSPRPGLRQPPSGPAERRTSTVADRPTLICPLRAAPAPAETPRPAFPWSIFWCWYFAATSDRFVYQETAGLPRGVDGQDRERIAPQRTDATEVTFVQGEQTKRPRPGGDDHDRGTGDTDP
jgi:hypothetical protein